MRARDPVRIFAGKKVLHRFHAEPEDATPAAFSDSPVRSSHLFNFAGLRITAAPEPSIQREAADSKPDKSEQQKPPEEAVPTSKSSDSQGTTEIQEPPTSKHVMYSGATLTDVNAAMPEEAAAVDFHLSVQAAGDPITTAKVSVMQTMTLPRWSERDKQCKEVQQAWDAFQSAMEVHERGHLAIDAREFASAHTRFIGKSQSDIQSESDALRQKVQKAQDDFDVQTDHGRKGTPATTIDLTAKCADEPKKTSEIEENGQTVMTKKEFAVSSPDDPYEREADEVSDRIMRMEPDRVRLQLVLPSREPCSAWRYSDVQLATA